MRRIIATISTLLVVTSGSSQITGPSTVVVGQSATWKLENAPINRSYTWAPDTVSQEVTGLNATTVSAAKLGAASAMTTADFPSMWYDHVSGRWFAFTVSMGVTGNTASKLYRLDLGNNPTPSNQSANPVQTWELNTLGFPGKNGANYAMHHAIVYNQEKQTWHLFWFRYNDMNGTNLYRLDFGNSLANNPTAADVVPINVSFSAQVAQSKFVRTESGKYVLFIGNRWGGPVRVDFGTDVLNTSPTLVDEMSNGAFTRANPFRSAAMDVVKHGDNWYVFCATTDASSHELWRYDLGSDIMNTTATPVSLGALASTNTHWGLQIIPSPCGGRFYGFINGRGDIVRLDFGNSLTNTPSQVKISTAGSKGMPSSADNSGLFCYTFGDSLYAVMGGANNHGIYSLRLPFNYTNKQTLTNKYPGDSTFTHTYTAPGTYSLYAAVNLNGGGAATYCHAVTVVAGGPATPGAYTAAPSSVCQGQNNVVYTVPTVPGAVAYHWYYTGSNVTYAASTSTSSNQLTFSSSATGGVLKVWAVDNSGDSSLASRDTTIVVNTPPTVNITPATVTICAGQSATLTASGATTYSWSNGAGSNASATVTPSTTTTYTVTGTQAGCSTTASRVVTVNPLPTVSISPATVEICEGESATLTASGATTYTWTPGSGSTATINVTPTTTTTYTVEGTNTATGCKNTASRQVVVNAVPVTSVTVSGGVTEVCAGDTVLITASGSGYNFSWKNEAGVTVHSGAQYAAVATGTYKVIAEDANSGCKDSSQEVTVFVYDPPVASLNQNDTAFCVGGVLLLEVDTRDTGLTYVWRRDGADIANAVSSFLEVDESGVYKVIVGRSDIASCEDSTNEVSLVVHPLPVVNITWDGVLLHATPGYSSYQWYNGTQAIPGAVDSTFEPTSNSGYSVSVIDDNGCENRSPVQNLNDVGALSVDVTSGAVSVEVYPNPSDGVIYIKAPGGVNVEVFALDGRVIGEYRNVNQLDLNAQPSGVYLLRISDAEGKYRHLERVSKR